MQQKRTYNIFRSLMRITEFLDILMESILFSEDLTYLFDSDDETKPEV